MKKDQRKNFLLITFDQWRGDWGNPHQPIVELPNLKKLADRGITATRCYTSSPHCVPARFSWLTGLMPGQMGVTENKAVWMPSDAPSFVRDLKEAGWYTSLVGKTHWTPHNEPYDLRDNVGLMHALGFDDVVEIGGPRAMRRLECELTDAWRKAGILEQHRNDLEERYGRGLRPTICGVKETVLPNHLYPDIWIANRAIQKIQGMNNDKPWFLWVSFCGPHEPFDTPKPWKGRNQHTELPKAQHLPDWVESQPKNSVLYQTTKRWKTLITENEINECRRDYADKLQLLDEQIGKLIRALDEKKQKTKTAIAITADHGEHLGDFGCMYKGSFLESAIRVPWIYWEATKSNKNNSNGSRLINKPINLTQSIQIITSRLTSCSNRREIINKLRQTKYSSVEFKDEILIIKGKKRLAAKIEGNVLWGATLKNEGNEERYLIDTDLKRKHWRDHFRILKEETEKRVQSDWLREDIECRRNE